MRWVKYRIVYAWWRMRAFAHDHFTASVLVLLISSAAILYLLPDVLVTINAGESGVLWKRFGGGTVTGARSGRPFRGRIAASRFGEPTVLTPETERNLN